METSETEQITLPGVGTEQETNRKRTAKPDRASSKTATDRRASPYSVLSVGL